MRVESNSVENDYLGGQWFKKAPFKVRGEACEGLVVGYSKPPVVRVMFTFPHRPDYVEECQSEEQVSHLLASGGVATLVERALEAMPAADSTGV